jgi:hypothetical protein
MSSYLLRLLLLIIIIILLLELLNGVNGTHDPYATGVGMTTADRLFSWDIISQLSQFQSVRRTINCPFRQAGSLASSMIGHARLGRSPQNRRPARCIKPNRLS